MELALSAEDAAFRDEVRAFIAENYPAEMRVPNPETDLTKEQMLLWHRILHQKGWIAPLWPREYGGPGWSITRRFIFEQETTRAGTLPPLAFSVTMVGPVIYTFGNDAQKKRFLPRILSGRTGGVRAIPSPGPVLTSPPSGPRRCATATTTSSTATRHGPRWPSTPTGSSAWCEPTRTPKPQSGISFLLIDMKSPGVTVRPIITIDGSHEVNDVFLEDVRVPAENLVGEENKGWTYAKFLLGNERTSMAGIGRSTRYIDRLKQIVKAEIAEDDPARLEFVTRYRQGRARRAGARSNRIARGGADGTGKSIRDRRPRCSRSAAPRYFRDITELTHRAIGNYGLAIREHPVSANHFMPGPVHGHTASEKYLNSRKLSIYGGSNEIQRNIIAKAVLGL